jgi:hypothetical protein
VSSTLADHAPHAAQSAAAVSAMRASSDRTRSERNAAECRPRLAYFTGRIRGRVPGNRRTWERRRPADRVVGKADGCWVAVPGGLDARARPHPLASFVQSIKLGGDPRHALGRTFISGGAWPGSPFVTLSERLRNDPGWRVHEIPVGHNIARRDPHSLAAILDALPPAGEKL